MTGPNSSQVSMAFQLKMVEAVLVRTKIKSPVRTSFGTMHDRPTLMVRVTDSSGIKGYGEIWCNYPDCGGHHRQQLVETEIAPRITNIEFASPQQCYKAINSMLHILMLQAGESGPIAQTIAGVDIAIWDMIARRAGVPVYQLLGAKRNEIPAYASGINPDGVLDTISRARDLGHRKFKIKVGFGSDIDRRNVEAVSNEISGEEKFLLDANQAWAPEAAKEEMLWIAPFAPFWVEEPMPVDVPSESWISLKDMTAIPIAGAENFLTREAYTAVIQQKWLDVIQPDIAKWGGFTECTPVAKEVVDNGLIYCPHSLGGGVALAASAHLLAAAGGAGMLECDINENPFRDEVFNLDLNDGSVRLSNDAGLGVNSEVLDSLFT